MRKHHYLLLALFILYAQVSFAQVSVDPLTGTGSMVIPLYTVQSGQVSLPVSISYTAGIKPKDVEGTAGMGWQLNVGGQVSRTVHGLPDDCTKDNSNNQRLGWMNSLDTAAKRIDSLTIQNNGSTCSYETADISYINSNFPYRNDTEPDMFYVSAPGLSCQMVYDRVSGKFKPINYQDLIISYTTDATTHLINSFTITNDKGVTYMFGNSNDAVPPAYNQVTRTALGTTPSYFKNQFLQYQHGITYYDTWSLQSITDANGNGVQLNYTTPGAARPSTDTLSLYIAGSTTPTTQYRVSESSTPYQLLNIQTFHNSAAVTYLTFTWTTSSTGQTIISSVNGMGHSFNFGYDAITYAPTSYVRYFLRTFSDPGCSSPVSYQFAYAGETLGPISHTTTLPDSTQNTFDYWGYYSTVPTVTSRMPAVEVNPSNASYPRYSVNGDDVNYPIQLGTTGAYRTVDAANIMAGSLVKVTYVTGGSTNIVYEPNDYLDVPSGTVLKGGGIRVKQVIDSVGIHSTNNMIRNYTYLNPSSGLSSGKPVSLPQYAFTIPYSGASNWASQSVLSQHDLSGEDHTIMYAYCKMSRTGAGSTQYQYNIPATYWDASAAPSCSGCTTEWHPTTDLIGRTNCSLSYGPVSNYVYAYPFLPNPNYDFERGLPVKVTSYNDSGTEASESNYTYSRSNTPTAINAFKNEDNPGSGVDVLAYNKYTIYYNTSELTTKVVNKVFDSQNLSQAHSDSVTYTYGSAYHKLLTQQQTTNSDGSTLTTHISYTKDYTAASGSNPNVTAIYNMQQKNINVPVEIYNQLTMAGTTKTTGAALTLFRDTTIFSSVYCLPSQQFKWVQTGSATFTPMTISGQTLTKDAGYFGTVNYDIYDNTGLPLTVDDTHKNIGTTLVNHLAGPIAVFKNAAYNQVAYADFDSDVANPPYGFTITGTGSYTPVGSHAGNAAGITSTQTVTTTSTLSKNTLAKYYIFSIWINAASPGTLTLTLSGVSPNPTIAYGANGAGWYYYETRVLASSIASSFTVSFTASNSISIDDILVYPDVASVATTTYDATAHYRIAATNTNGVSSYFVNDQWGRTVYVYDQDHNIVQKNTMVTAADVGTFSSASPTIVKSTVYNAVATSFSIGNWDACATAGTSVQWNFGDGTIVNAAGLVSPSHTYYTTSTQTVTATITSPVFGTKAPTTSVTPAIYPIPVTYNSLTTGNGDISSVTLTAIGSGTNYSFTGSTLQGAHVNQGKYTVTIKLADGQQYNSGTGLGYNCVVIIADGLNIDCSNYASTNSYTFTVDLTNNTTLNFTVSQFDCSHFPPPS